MLVKSAFDEKKIIPKKTCENNCLLDAVDSWFEKNPVNVVGDYFLACYSHSFVHKKNNYVFVAYFEDFFGFAGFDSFDDFEKLKNMSFDDVVRNMEFHIDLVDF